MAKSIDVTAFDAFDGGLLPDDEPAKANDGPAQEPAAKVAEELTFIESMDFGGPLIFDIETGPLPDTQLAEMFEFDETKMPGYDLIGAEFDPSTVKYGNLKDETKRSEKLQAAREKFEADKTDAERRFATAEQDAFEAFKDTAALSALTCQVLTVAYLDVPTGRKVLDDGGDNEAELLTTFWELVAYCRTKNVKLVGFNSNTFDVPVLARRAMYHAVPLPMFRQGRYLDKIFIDCREAWGCGEWQPKGSLDDLARFFGGPAKNGSGKDFHKLWHGTPEEHERARRYALNDLDMTLAVAQGVQVI
jgi:hypothetical protein